MEFLIMGQYWYSNINIKDWYVWMLDIFIIFMTLIEFLLNAKNKKNKEKMKLGVLWLIVFIWKSISLLLL